MHRGEQEIKLQEFSLYTFSQTGDSIEKFESIVKRFLYYFMPWSLLKNA